MVKTALVVDDSKTIRDMVAMTLASMEFDVTTADDGVQGLDEAKHNKFDIIRNFNKIIHICQSNMDCCYIFSFC